MPFLVWNNEDDAKDSLAAIDAMYGLPFEAANGYKMDQWDVVKESETSSNAGFYKPEERLGMVMDDLMPALMPGFTEHEEMPEEFEPEEEEEEEEGIEIEVEEDGEIELFDFLQGTANVTVAGLPIQGQELFAVVNSEFDVVGYQWLLIKTISPGVYYSIVGTELSYILGPDEVDNNIVLHIMYRNNEGELRTNTSQQIRVVGANTEINTKGIVTITGSRVDGGRLEATLYGADSPVEGSFAYRWFHTLDILTLSTEVVGATEDWLYLTPGEAFRNPGIFHDHLVSAEVSYTDTENIVQTITSAWTEPIETPDHVGSA